MPEKQAHLCEPLPQQEKKLHFSTSTLEKSLCPNYLLAQTACHAGEAIRVIVHLRITGAGYAPGVARNHNTTSRTEYVGFLFANHVKRKAGLLAGLGHRWSSPRIIDRAASVYALARFAQVTPPRNVQRSHAGGGAESRAERTLAAKSASRTASPVTRSQGGASYRQVKFLFGAIRGLGYAPRTSSGEWWQT